ncbi:MAG: 2-oxoacid:ferredoxin oxidoreductase subunit gamma, partial [Clostridia bacterium]|nr:2-oxoacid:ferredoxin oxidoreductase subunit gamma [Clostridia bacterium]
LGAIVGITHVVSEEALKEAVLERIPAGTEEMNIKALNAGRKAGQEVLQTKVG